MRYYWYSVLQSTTGVLLCTTKYYSGTHLYYKELLQYYSVLQSTTPVLLCTTKYYFVLLCTTKYYKVLLCTTKYYSVLQSTTPRLICPTKYHSSTNLYYKVLLRTAKYYSSTTKYYSVLPSTTPVLLCTKKYYSRTTQYYKVLQSNTHDWSSLHMNRHLQCAEQPKSLSNITKYCACHDCHIWNVIYNARSNRSHCLTSPNTAPAPKSHPHHWSLSHMSRYLQCAEQQVSWSNLTKYCACGEKSPSSLIPGTYEPLFTMCGATRVMVQPHQILRLPRKVTLIIDPCHIWAAIYNARSNKCHGPTSPCLRRKVTLIIDPCHIWNAIYNARSNKCHGRTSPNIAPATKNKRPICERNLVKTDETSFTIRDRSENDPTMIRPWNRHGVSPQPAPQPRLLFALSASILYWKIQRFALRLSFQISRNIAPATKIDTATSPNTAPATKNDSPDQSSSHMKRYLQCVEQRKSSSNVTKYCACHEKWL